MSHENNLHSPTKERSTVNVNFTVDLTRDSTPAREEVEAQVLSKPENPLGKYSIDETLFQEY